MAQTVEIHDNVARHFRGKGGQVMNDGNQVRLQITVPNKSLPRLKNYIQINKANLSQGPVEDFSVIAVSRNQKYYYDRMKRLRQKRKARRQNRKNKLAQK